MRILAGDIGGTNTRLAIVEADAGHVRVLHKRRFSSGTFSGLAPIVRAFLSGVSDVPRQACFGIACPVIQGQCTVTNLAWRIDRAVLEAEIGIPRTQIINDFQALAHAVPRLTSADVVTLQLGDRIEGGVVALIGAGTGLGQAFITFQGDSYQVNASEGGHATFTARNELECGLAASLADGSAPASFERVLSGSGLVRIYTYLAAGGSPAERASVQAEMKRADPAAVIVKRALAADESTCGRALAVFISAYGAHAGDFALTVMATGGIFVGGGIARRIVSRLQDGSFMNAFRDKGRLRSVLQRVPVRVIVNPDAGIIGAAAAMV